MTDATVPVSAGRLPFGRPVQPCRPSASGPRRVFILGAYPSALHVAWQPPGDFKSIRAIAVDNEPEPFWTGIDELVRVEAWKKAVGFDEERWGNVNIAGTLNGSSGEWVEKKLLSPLETSRSDAWITDCLDTYRCSDELKARIDNTYNPFADTTGGDLLPAMLLPHPSERNIVEEALRLHRDRLSAELETASPQIVVTLGNAALKVFRSLCIPISGEPPRRLIANVTYGHRHPVRIGKHEVEWLPLAHPAAPSAYQTAHNSWLEQAGARAG